ncbi:hypothetical protein ACHAXT_002295 [Thalassiosira profunda]
MPPPPPPSASYNLKFDDSSSDEEEYGVDYHRQLMARRDEASYSTVEATSLQAMTSENGAATTPIRRSPRKLGLPPSPGLEEIARRLHTEEEAEGGAGVAVANAMGEAEANGEAEISSPPTKKKKKKRKKKKKKKPKSKVSERAATDPDEEVSEDDIYADAEAAEAVIKTAGEEAGELTAANPTAKTTTDDWAVLDSKPRAAPPVADRTPSKIRFGDVSVREYARTLGTHVVPADGGWPLGLSGEVIAEHPRNETNVTGTPPSSPGMRSRSNSVSSPGKKHHHSYPDTWKVDDFESRKQMELQERFIQLVREERRRKFEKEWEKRHHLHVRRTPRKQNRPRSRSGSFGNSNDLGGGGGGGRSCSGSMKMEMSAEEKEELERIVSQPVDLPEGELETRPYDYKKKVLPKSPKQKGKKEAASDATQHTEEEELYDRHGGRNPLFQTMRENDRRKVLLRDDHLMKQCQVIDTPRKSRRISSASCLEDETLPLDPEDSATTQHIQHDLETLRIQRSDATNLGCSCRKLHVFLPGATDKSHHKKKGSHRRLPERKVREELRKRGLLNKGDDNMSREKMERRLHDAIESEPCCWGNDCPCVRNGIGCQADTCSCWHASHDVAHGGASGAPSCHTGKEQDAETMKARCGNSQGLYVVNWRGISEHREKYVGTPVKT